MSIMRDARYMLAYLTNDGAFGEEDRGAKAVAQNLRFCQHAVDIGEWPRMRVFVSDRWPGVLITRDDVRACRDPHVLEWIDTMKEISVGQLLARVSSSAEIDRASSTTSGQHNGA